MSIQHSPGRQKKDDTSGVIRFLKAQACSAAEFRGVCWELCMTNQCLSKLAAVTHRVWREQKTVAGIDVMCSNIALCKHAGSPTWKKSRELFRGIRKCPWLKRRLTSWDRVIVISIFTDQIHELWIVNWPCMRFRPRRHAYQMTPGAIFWIFNLSWSRAQKRK